MSKGTGMNPTVDDEMIQETFDFFDKDGSGTISSSEFGSLVRALGFNPTDAEVEKEIEKLDLNSSGRLEFNEFKIYLSDYKKRHKNSPDAIRNAFKLFDRDGNGYIEAKELKTIMSNCGQDLSDEFIEQMIGSADIDNDGRINYGEFTDFICKPIK